MLTTDLRLGGAERTVINLALCLRNSGVECAVAGLCEGDEGTAHAHLILKQAGFPVFCARIERPPDFRCFGELRRFVQGWRPDVIHCHMFHGHLAGVALKLSGCGAPMVWSHHSVQPGAYPLRAAFYRFFLRLGDAHVFVSEAVRDYQHRLGGRAPRERIVHNGTDLGPFLALRPLPGLTFGAVGRLVPLTKGFDVLIRAFARVCRELPGAALRIAGDGSERAALQGLAQAEGAADRVEFVGFVGDVPAFLAGVNVFVNPSRWEAFGNTLVEGMAAGLPCIASRVGGLAEIGADLVRWVRPGDVDDLCEAMLRTAGAPWPAERVAAQRRHVQALFSREAMAERYLEVYRSLRPGLGRRTACGGGREGGP